MVKTVIFDIDNTLYDYNKAHAVAFGALEEYAAQNLGMGPGEFASLHKKAETELKARFGEVSAVHNRTIRYQYILERQGLPLFPHLLEMTGRYWGTLLRAAQPAPGAAEAMRALKRIGMRIGIGTNMAAFVQLYKLSVLGLLPYVDFFVSSEEAGAEKPSQVFFKQCAAKAGCSAKECLFIGDSLEMDVYGAAGAGMQSLWYCPDACPDGRDARKITSFYQLPGAVSGLWEDTVEG